MLKINQFFDFLLFPLLFAYFYLSFSAFSAAFFVALSNLSFAFSYFLL
jgi:hypothetical protein